MNHSMHSRQSSVKSVQCPYCSEETVIDMPEDYAPVFAYCDVCSKKYILERLAEGVQVLTVEGAPCCSNPDCREIEMGGSDEQ